MKIRIEPSYYKDTNSKQIHNKFIVFLSSIANKKIVSCIEYVNETVTAIYTK